ncbi:30S ribosomal protein S8 [Chitinivibrio alkaliphilus]|uniref:Small ribosomal subunit protein uS8 n=1 Tax=Chitinivibrio alkaliphilus ACht1 TaxID=1313304 RepID=U7D896_9BACT|nr:30S ribosomal protein S8 [Chitinivibrio alkaliphilus]ERP31302.1 30S ribosomal protein S8 [Chitinivibrio alkaliphilus ACht1]
MVTDPIADMFTIIRNGVRAGRRSVSIPASRVKKEITDLLSSNGFISKYAFVDDGVQGEIKILLKYDDRERAAIQDIQRVSKPSRRVYSSADELPRVLGGLGMCIVSTNKGVMSDYQCRKENVGGEILGKIW